MTPSLAGIWNSPDLLHQAVLSDLRGQRADVAREAAGRLVELEGDSARAQLLAAVVDLKTGHLSEARQRLEHELRKRGESAELLLNLALVDAEQQRPAEALARATKAISLAPTNPGLLWWSALARTQLGEAAYLAQLAQWASRPGAFLAQLLIARHHLESGAFADAETWHRKALTDAPAQALQEVLVAWGRVGRTADGLRLAAPLFEARRHGAAVGAELVAAYLAQRSFTEARRVCGELTTAGSTSAAALLDQVERAAQSAAASAPQEGELKSLPVFGPVWLAGLENPTWLAPRGDKAKLIAVLPFADGMRDAGKPSERGDAMAQATRSVPLFVSEALRLSTDAESYTVVPLLGQQGLMAPLHSWDLAAYLPMLPASHLPKWVVTGVFTENVLGQLQLDLTAVRLSDRAVVAQVRVSSGAGASGLAGQAAAKLTQALEKAQVLQRRPVASSLFTAAPTAEHLSLSFGLLGPAAAAAGALTGVHSASELTDAAIDHAARTGTVASVVMAASAAALARRLGRLSPPAAGKLVSLLSTSPVTAGLVPLFTAEAAPSAARGADYQAWLARAKARAQ